MQLKILIRILDVTGNEEQEINCLRQYKHEISFLVGNAELEGLLNYEEARKCLTIVAEVILQEAFKMAVRRLGPRYCRVLEKFLHPVEFVVLALRKLGGRELGYHSDIDLIFLHPASSYKNSQHLLVQEYGVKLIQRTISLLTTTTRAGFAYKMDTRLRPSGNAGILITPWDVYLKYHQHSEPWELQALIKNRIVAGQVSELWFEEVEKGIK